MFTRIYQIILLPLYQTYRKWQDDDGPQMAAGISYYMALSFFPLVLVLLSVTGMVMQFTHWGRGGQEQLIELIRQQAGPELALHVETTLRSLQTKAGIGGPIGLLILLWTSMKIFTHLDKAFDRIWDMPSRVNRGLWGMLGTVLWRRLRGFLMLLGVGIFLFAGFSASMTFSAAQSYLRRNLAMPEIAWDMATLVPVLLLNCLLFMTMFKVLPKVRVRWIDAATGALLTAVLWEIGRAALAFFVLGKKYSAYGVVGAFIVVMLWFYCAATLVFLGAEFVRVLGLRHEKKLDA